MVGGCEAAEEAGVGEGARPPTAFPRSRSPMTKQTRQMTNLPKTVPRSSQCSPDISPQPPRWLCDVSSNPCPRRYAIASVISLHRLSLTVIIVNRRWFLMTMGTGIVAILLHQLPYQFRGLQAISLIFFFLNILIFIALSLFSLLRYILWPEITLLMLRHPVQSLFLYCHLATYLTVEGRFRWAWKLSL